MKENMFMELRMKTEVMRADLKSLRKYKKRNKFFALIARISIVNGNSLQRVSNIIIIINTLNTIIIKYSYVFIINK